MSEKQEQSKSSVKSGAPNREYMSGPLGGNPPKKSVAEIDRQNSPQGRKRAPGSVRV